MCARFTYGRGQTSSRRRRAARVRISIVKKGVSRVKPERSAYYSARFRRCALIGIASTSVGIPRQAVARIENFTVIAAHRPEFRMTLLRRVSRSHRLDTAPLNNVPCLHALSLT